ncbi:SAM-dependent methyltransferase [Halobacteriales archaeon QS_4_70_19]|nr:MAG: SAM-dependent methyltransferase [Halobacteriales archaeon QS_4_70_19]
MKKSIDEHAARFDEAADSYDADKSAEYEACAGLVIEHARGNADSARGRDQPLRPDDVVLDLGTGTGAIALALAGDAGRVVGRDISDGMLERAREKATEQGIDNVEFGDGTFREPNYDGPVDVVVSNFAMHHLSDAEKREAIDVIAGLSPGRIVLGDVMFFGEPDPSDPFYSPDVDDPATVGVLVDAFTDAGYAVTAVELVHEQVGVVVADRLEADAGADKGFADEPVGMNED